MSHLSEHWFGLPVPGGVKPVRAWGARAILRNETTRKPVKKKGRVVGYDHKIKVTFELLHDRQSYRGPDDPGKEAFMKWLNKEAIPALAETVDEAGLGLDEDRPVSVGETTGAGVTYTLIANPRKSYGYLYIVALEYPNGQASEDAKEG